MARRMSGPGGACKYFGVTHLPAASHQEQSMRRPFWLALAIAAGAATPIRAQGWIEVRQAPPSTRPTPIGGPVIRVQSDVRVSLNGRIAQVEVAERFRNAGSTIA